MKNTIIAFVLRLRRIPDAIVTKVDRDARSTDLKSNDFLSVPTALV